MFGRLSNVLQSCILVLELLGPVDVSGLQATEMPAPVVARLLADSVLLRDLGDWHLIGVAQDRHPSVRQ